MANNKFPLKKTIKIQASPQCLIIKCKNILKIMDQFLNLGN